MKREKIKECLYCGFFFEENRNRKKYCSRDCHNRDVDSEKNPNFKYNKKENLFSLETLTQEDAYILGFIWAEGHLGKKGGAISIYQHQDDKEILQQISQYIFGQDLVKTKKNSKICILDICSKQIVKNVLDLRGINLGKKSHLIEIPNIPVDFYDSFICGFFDGDGTLRFRENSITMNICSFSPKFLEQITDHFNLQAAPHRNQINVYGFRALDLLGRIYSKTSIRMKRKYEKYLSIINWTPNTRYKKQELFYYRKLTKDAVAPNKTNVTDSGYDLSIVELEKVDFGKNIYLADTKISVVPEHGWYFDCIARSSLVKNGWQFLGGVGVIDRSYTGSIKLYLQKLDDRELPKMPFKCAQIIPRPIVHYELKEVFESIDSNRKDGGFGSTDKQNEGEKQK